MKKLFFMGLALMLSCAMKAQPQFHINATNQRVGEILFQTPKTVTFEFENTGDKPLVISEVHPSCGCVQVSYPQSVVRAGSKGSIIAVYDAAILGTFHRELAVYTNISQEPIYLSFEGRVVNGVSTVDYSTDFPIDLGDVRMSTSSIEFDDVNKGDKPVAELRVVNTGKGAYTPQLMHLPNYLQAEYIPKVIQGGRVGTIRLTLDSEKLYMNGLNQTNIYLARYMGDKVSESNEIVVSAVLLPSFASLTKDQMAKAPRIVLMDGEDMVMGEMGMSTEQTHKNKLVFWKNGKKTKLTKVLNVTNIGEEPLNISAVQVFNRAVSVSLGNRVIPAHGTTKLKVTVDTKLMEKAKNKPRVLIICNDPRHAKTVLNINVE